MRTFDISAEFRVAPTVYLRDAYSAAFKAFQLAALGSSAAVVLSDRRADGWHTVVLRNAPASDPPWAVRRMLRGRRLEYIETRRRRIGAERSLPCVTHFSSVCTLTDRVRVEGTVRIEPSSKPGRTLQRFRGVCAVTLPAPLGPAMEKMIVAQIQRSYARLPAIVDDWVQVRDSALAAQRRADVASAVSPAAARAALLAAGAEAQRLLGLACGGAAAVAAPLLRIGAAA